jgi:hypothetical protein
MYPFRILQVPQSLVQPRMWTVIELAYDHSCIDIEEESNVNDDSVSLNLEGRRSVGDGSSLCSLGENEA